MESQPIMSHNRTYGVANPGYVPEAVAGAPAMFAPPAAGSFGPSAPPANMFDTVPGYEGTMAGEGGGFLPPPMPLNPVPQPQPGPEQPQWNIPSITEDTAKEAFALFASSKCCYSSAPAKEGGITNMEAFNTYRYRLETFTESRSTQWAQEPYHGQPVDAYSSPPPGPWDIPAKVPSFFQDSKQIIKVPYTSSMKTCHVCLGMGRKPCRDCAGAGNKACWVCNGSGYRHGDDRCHHCNGRGRENCSHCHGQGSKQCPTCHGKQQLLVYINLTVKWTNNSDNYVVEQSSGLQVENLSKVSGQELFRDSQYLVYPLMSFPDMAVVNASQRFVSEHQGKFSQTSRILQQRQTIELIPVTRVTYSWKGKSHIYFVYGNEFKVSTDDYPATCCCTVM
ncbi:protein SSUH2 homolog isoform X1 [Sphaeramia orbicularis]|uniref:Protein SSUH2 homolog n=2 Tax=Sphaeramia orbicularis TaxID=375764 RepID=A0A673A5J8_9TELE|nr:protein SSUH2 homolog isoform X1 [Sphaeramia orbicularis]XP_029994003.1 protein SSUH2 homolog isoform X1 [Sphaeramia orbicularis]XP_029994004.1 protein SSUH2 homolog isoform X1 [Sphaeramia orbicularis]